jgi:GAF domain-containing protein
MTTELIRTIVQEVDQMLEDGIPKHKILARLVGAAESVSGSDSVSSILVLDENGRLRNGSSPRLPQDYLAAIDGLRPNANVGTCAAAAATGSMVITSDFRDDNKWAELRHLPLALGFICAYSIPIKNSAGAVLGTFGTYFREKREPSDSEIEAVETLAGAAAKVLHHGR